MVENINLSRVGNQPFPTHPYHAFVELKIGEFDFTPIPPEHLISFEAKFTTDVGDNGIGQGTFTVFDDTALRIEYALWTALEQASDSGMIRGYFKFGYSETPHISHMYSMVIYDYDLVLKASGAELTIKMLSKGIETHGVPVALAYNTEDSDFKSLDEIIRDMFEHLGCDIDEIQEIEDIIVQGDDNNGQLIEKQIEVRIDNIAVTYGTINKILAICKAKGEDDTNLVLTFIDEGEGNVKVNVTSYGYNADKGEPVKEYSIAWDGESGEVISFNPQFEAGMIFAGGGTVDVDAFDMDEMKAIITEHDAFTNPNKFLIGGKEMFVSPNSATVIPNNSSGMIDTLARKANYLWHKGKTLQYTATMDILGDPYLEVMDLITIIVRTPSGIPHHTSGIYIIKEITHTISGGSWKTSLQLLRDPSEAMVEIIGNVIGSYYNQPLNPNAEPPDKYKPLDEIPLERYR